MFKSRPSTRAVAQSKDPSATTRPAHAGVAQRQSARLLSEEVGVRLLSPAPINQSRDGVTNGRRSGLRPRGLDRPWEFDSPSRDHTYNRRSDRSPSVIAPTMGRRPRKRSRVRFPAAKPRPDDATRPNVAKLTPSRSSRVIAYEAAVAGSIPAGVTGRRSSKRQSSFPLTQPRSAPTSQTTSRR